MRTVETRPQRQMNMPPTATVIKTDPEEDIVMEEADDEIVREIDVLLSPAMASQLHLMQFPLQHEHVPLPEAARIKKDHGMIELDENIPHNAGNEGLFSLDQRTFTSQTIPVSTHMALAKMSVTGKELHVVPLSHISQMRPSFAHVDETTNDPEVVTEKEEEKLEKKPVMFHKKETERSALARKSSFAYKKASQDSEAWKMLIVCGPDTLQHRKAEDSIICPSPSTPLVSASTTAGAQNASSAFVHSLNYLPPAVHDVDEVAPSDIRSVCAQLTVSLQRGWPVPFSVVKNQFPAVSDEDLMTALSSCAVLVRGNFVLQSQLLPLTPALQQARTFILFLLQRVGHVERVRLEHVFREREGVTSEAIQMLLEQVAIRGVHGWQPKIQDNLDLYEVFPEHTQLHTQYWERQETRFADFLQLYNEAQVT